jgi:glycosyltransferase involved in cell wall biosynthesis
LESVLSQKGVDLEVIVVDDASSDSTASVAREWAERDRRVRVLRHIRNKGHIATFNEGLEEATGDFVMKLDADDMLAPGALARASAVMDEHPAVTLVYGRPHHFEGHTPALPPREGESCVIWPGEVWLAERCSTGKNCISNPEVLVRRSAVEATGFYDARLPHTFDFEMWLRLAALGDVARIDDAVQGVYRVHPESFQRTIHAGVLTDLRGRRDAFDVAFDGPVGRVAHASELYELAREQIAREALDQAAHTFDRGRASPELTEQLASLALETWPQVRSTREWRALARRRFVGERYARYIPPFIAHAGFRRLRGEWRKARWRRLGI